MTTERRKGRARLERAQQNAATEEQASLLDKINAALPGAVDLLIKEAQGGDSDAVEALIRLGAAELDAARAAKGDPVLERIKEIRRLGSPQMAATWAILYRNGLPVVQS